MEETQKTYRLSKVASECNVGLSNVIECLKKKGFTVDSNPNSKLTSEMYELILKEFQSEKQVKETSKKLDIGMGSRETITVDSAREKERVAEQEPEDVVMIKSTSAPAVEKEFVKTEPKQTPESDPEPQLKAEPTVLTPVQKAEIVVENQIITDTEKPVQTETTEELNKKETSEIKVIRTIDLEALTPKKKKKTSPKPEPDAKESAEQTEIIEDTAVIQDTTHITETKEEEITSSEVTEPKTEITAENSETITEAIILEEPETPTVSEEKPKDENFIKTEYTKLDGPKILGKIVLEPKKDPVKKPVATSSDDTSFTDRKKRRKRIKKENTQTVNTTPKPDNTKQKHKKGKVEKQKPEISVDEIQKQISETLARLSKPTKSKASKYRRIKRDMVQQHMEEEQLKIEEEKKILKVTEFVTASELSKLMEVAVTDIISTCMSLGLFVSINQRLDAEVLSIVAEEFGYKVEFIAAEVQEAINDSEDTDEDLEERHPIVTVMGHVDHGKTSLLDYIRRSNVIAGEAGGITQHIGAYEVTLENGKKITFLDTPGHEAFTAMRARGAKVTDIAIIVVAADDNVMPQTIEAINHAQAAKVPLIFAINKIDKPGANPEKIKEELAKMNLLVEDWGGKYQSQEISAKKGLNIDKLLEKVLLESELLELKANHKKRALGTVLESSLEKGRGYVAKLLVQNGTMHVGDMVLAGYSYGRVKAMYNERNMQIDSAGPSSPVLMLGLNGAPQAGDGFNSMADEREAKEIANKRQQLQREQSLRTHKHITLDEIGRRIAIGDFKELNLIIKGDVDGSVEALSDSLLKLSTSEVQVNVIHKTVGQITESDVLLAQASNAIIIGFQVRPSVNARRLAEQEQIDIRLYSVIYNAINEITMAIEGMLSPEIEEKIVCNLEIREIFKITKVGTIAGCVVLDGKINRNTKVRIIRNGIVVYSGNLGSLKRYKDEVKEVFPGQDCGLNIENFNDVKVGDIIEGYDITEVKRKL